jgi:hypothetical protein
MYQQQLQVATAPNHHYFNREYSNSNCRNINSINRECSYIHTSAKTKDCNNAILNNASTFHRTPFLDKLGAAGKTAVVEHYEKAFFANSL